MRGWSVAIVCYLAKDKWHQVKSLRVGISGPEKFNIKNNRAGSSLLYAALWMQFHVNLYNASRWSNSKLFELKSRDKSISWIHKLLVQMPSQLTLGNEVNKHVAKRKWSRASLLSVDGQTLGKTAARPLSPRAQTTSEDQTGESRRRLNNSREVYSADQDNAGQKVVGSNPVANKRLFLPKIWIHFSPTSFWFIRNENLSCVWSIYCFYFSERRISIYFLTGVGPKLLKHGARNVMGRSSAWIQLAKVRITWGGLLQLLQSLVAIFARNTM